MTKNFFLFLFISFFAASVCTAQSLTVGVQGQAKSTWLINTAVLGASVEQEAKPSFAWGGGITANVFFQQQIETYWGVGLEANFGNFVQRYSGRVSDTTTYKTYNSRINLLFVDVPVYAKLVLRYGTYIEAGMQFSLLAGATYKATGGLETSTNVSSKFSPFYYAPLIGIGSDIDLGTDLYIFAGLRMVYGLSNLKGVDGQGNDVTKPLPNYPDYTGSKTHAASVVLNIGAYYRFDYGKFGRAKRGRRH